MQLNLLPQTIRRVDPCIGRSADSLGVGVAASGQRYVLKASVPWHPQMPASEWICHALAKYMNLAIPHWEQCILPDGRDALGSRIEGNVLEREFFPLARPVSDNPEVVSGTYVLDLFVANADRHKGQWLLTEAGGGTLLRPIDFSRAWFRRWPLPTPPFGQGATMPSQENDNSGHFYVTARRHAAVASEEAIAAWESLRSLPKDVWRGIIHSLPPGWVDSQQAIDLVNWWWSPQWHTRISWIRTQL